MTIEIPHTITTMPDSIADTLSSPFSPREDTRIISQALYIDPTSKRTGQEIVFNYNLTDGSKLKVFYLPGPGEPDVFVPLPAGNLEETQKDNLLDYLRSYFPTPPKNHRIFSGGPLIPARAGKVTTENIPPSHTYNQVYRQQLHITFPELNPNEGED